MKAVNSRRTSIRRRLFFPKEKSISCVPQIIVKIQLRIDPVITERGLGCLNLFLMLMVL